MYEGYVCSFFFRKLLNGARDFEFPQGLINQGTKILVRKQDRMSPPLNIGKVDKHAIINVPGEERLEYLYRPTFHIRTDP